MVSHVTLETCVSMEIAKNYKLAEDMLQRRRFVLSARIWWTCVLFLGAVGVVYHFMTLARMGVRGRELWCSTRHWNTS